MPRALAQIDPAIPIVTLATAHPAKFPDAVERATGTSADAARAGRRSVRARGALCRTARRAMTRLPPMLRSTRFRTADGAACDPASLADRRRLGRLRAGRQRPWAQARTLWRLSLHPARTPGAVGAAARSVGCAWRIRARFGRGWRRALALRPAGSAATAGRWPGTRWRSPPNARRSAISASFPTWRRCGTGCAGSWPASQRRRRSTCSAIPGSARWR